MLQKLVILFGYYYSIKEFLILGSLLAKNFFVYKLLLSIYILFGLRQTFNTIFFVLTV
jgi:hypothetical protein